MKPDRKPKRKAAAQPKPKSKTESVREPGLKPEAVSDVNGVSRFPGWFPAWAQRLAELYFSGTTSVFVLHGNIFDHVRINDGDGADYDHLSAFLSAQLFGRWDLVLHYDLARGIRALAGRDEKRLREMVALANKRIGDLSDIPRDPARVLKVLDSLVLHNLMWEDEKRLSVAVLLDHACYVVPQADPGHLALPTSTNLVTLLNWGTSPYVKRLNMAFVLMEEKLASINDRLAGNPHVATVEVPLPARDDRERFLEHLVGDDDFASFSDFGAPALAEQTAGMSLTDLRTLVAGTRERGARLDAAVFRSLKKRLLERQAQGFLEFIEPRWSLDMVVGHDAAKRRLVQDAELLRRGMLDAVPMGYLFCGSVGTGKSFLAQCASGSFGVPCVMLKNFRSKYVGETEGNLERILSVLRAMGPVVVIIDEADAALGDRDQGGDSGTASRVFAMIAAQMGDTRYRGRIMWMLLTCRPDLLPIDLKRQGRAEVHVPLFYPQTQDEMRDMFVVMGKKLGVEIAPGDVPALEEGGRYSGADIEGMVGRAWRGSLLAGDEAIGGKALADVAARFIPSTDSLERELQEIAAIIECTDRQYLPPAVLKKIEDAGGPDKLQRRLTALKHMLESM